MVPATPAIWIVPLRGTHSFFTFHYDLLLLIHYIYYTSAVKP